VEASTVTAARDEILARIRAVDRPVPDEQSRTYRRRGERTRTELVSLFAERVADYKATVERVPATDIAARVAALGVAPLGVPAGIPKAWLPDGADAVVADSFGPRELDALGGVLTGCTAAIAETGTIVLAGGPAEGPRALTLVPDLHICVVRAEQIAELVPEAIATLAPLVRDARSPLTFVSGPSATSDIELSRVEGVHGPRTLVVLIVDAG
jgi:L-lactate dehydrogenase complex protein LldG